MKLCKLKRQKKYWTAEMAGSDQICTIYSFGVLSTLPKADLLTY